MVTMRLGTLLQSLFAASAVVASAVLAAPRVGPADVDAALLRAKIAPEAMVAIVQEVGATQPRLAWQPDQPVNPASLMKLLTTYRRARPARPGLDLDHAGLAAGQRRRRRPRRRPGDQGQRRPEAGARAHLAAAAPRAAAGRARDPRRHRARPQRLRRARAETRPTSTASRCGPTTSRADALLLNYRSVLLTFTPDAGARDARRSASDPPLAGVQSTPACRCADGPATTGAAA